LAKRAGIQRYGFALPMDDAEAKVLLDFGGRPWIEWNVNFQREKIGNVPTEMFFHFFKSFSDHAKCNLNIEANGTNEHHLIESVFKAFAKALFMAKNMVSDIMDIPSTKGNL
jgi:imidazoleglycerol-phosphate dehydratase/histidinol-phosphatase